MKQHSVLILIIVLLKQRQYIDHYEIFLIANKY